MPSIRVRLTVLFVVIVTLVLTVFGVLSYLKLQRELAERSAELQRGVVTRLQTSLPTPMWSLEAGSVADILAAELLPAEVRAIRIFDSSGVLFVARARGADGRVFEPAPGPSAPGALAMPLNFRSGVSGAARPVLVGRAEIEFSDAGAVRALADDALRKALEILLLDTILIAALALALRMVFDPLQRLCQRLLELAQRDGEHVDELPEQKKDEFGDVARAFNRIVRRLKAIIERTRAAEEAALHSEHLTTEAYQALRLAQDDLVQAERLASLGGLVAGIAHEINTPVGITLTSASVLLDATVQIKIAMGVGSLKKSDMLAYLETAAESTHLIMVNADRAAHLIQSFKQIAADQTSEARRRFVLQEYLDEIILSLRPRLKQSRVAVVIDCPKFLSVDGYPGAFAQIITNLVMNALIHAFDADTPGQIRIDIVQQGEMIQLDFADNGRGIPPQLIDKIFDPFFTTRRGQGGTGLGLNIVYNLIVKTFGGNVTVTSTVGQGSCFTIRIPQVAP